MAAERSASIENVSSMAAEKSAPIQNVSAHQPVLLGRPRPEAEKSKAEKGGKDIVCGPGCVVICISSFPTHEDVIEGRTPDTKVYCTDLRDSILKANKSWLQSQALDGVLDEIRKCIDQVKAATVLEVEQYSFCKAEKKIPALFLLLGVMLLFSSLLALAVDKPLAKFFFVPAACSFLFAMASLLCFWRSSCDDFQEALALALVEFSSKFNADDASVGNLEYHSEEGLQPAYFLLEPRRVKATKDSHQQPFELAV
eukprot:TRINITY_DN63558_c0_g1_i1.p1 TRINITY_DN63558_c0_g1~~TRINITY_DN63558_c0_g1_i1.p1  ORF type:complete len:284 (+),score=40.86 TRINITY_DN63558_c0_g1_i1:90-854(+)